jgi:hypothetical protein
VAVGPSRCDRARSKPATIAAASVGVPADSACDRARRVSSPSAEVAVKGGGGWPHHLDPGVDRTNPRLWGLSPRWIGNPDRLKCVSVDVGDRYRNSRPDNKAYREAVAVKSQDFYTALRGIHAELLKYVPVFFRGGDGVRPPRVVDVNLCHNRKRSSVLDKGLRFPGAPSYSPLQAGPSLATRGVPSVATSGRRRSADLLRYRVQCV